MRKVIVLLSLATLALAGCQQQAADTGGTPGAGKTTQTETGVSASNNGAKELSLNPNGTIAQPGSALKK
ncbi:MAG: hypothetical protein JSS66_01520 [Armatimonadetes bacterium]|nr:hypothetical protein [Armatimonadota bacterium]